MLVISYQVVFFLYDAWLLLKNRGPPLFCDCVMGLLSDVITWRPALFAVLPHKLPGCCLP
jgi:hypothetical protein